MTKLEKRLDYMEWKTEQMNKQITDMDREEVTMRKLVDNAQKAIRDTLKNLLLSFVQNKKFDYLTQVIYK